MGTLSVRKNSSCILHERLKLGTFDTVCMGSVIITIKSSKQTFLWQKDTTGVVVSMIDVSVELRSQHKE